MRVTTRFHPFTAILIAIVATWMAQTRFNHTAALGADTRVSIGSPPAPFSQNKQNEPAVAIAAAHSNIIAAGANDNIDTEACNAGDPATCPFTAGDGSSGIYFSFDSGTTWTQPTYIGFTARDCLGPAACTPHTGPIGTLPGYFENGLVSNGDPALAFGPRPDESGHFSWANGSRLYYANLTENFPGSDTIKRAEAVAVSRTDDVASAAAGNAAAWFAPVIATRQSSTTFSDKEQIWATTRRAALFFGRVYLCVATFRSNSQGLAYPQPLIVATSSDGGDTWSQKQVTPAATNAFNPRFGLGRSGCTVRTDSHGVVYVFVNEFALGTPGSGAHVLVKSFDGGRTWTPHRTLFTWSAALSVGRPGDRGYYAAVALSPDGTDAYVVYNAFTMPFRDDTTSQRALVGVVLHADVSASGAPAAFAELHRGVPGDPCASSQNNQVLEFLGDYVYAAATNTYAIGVWNDVRDGSVCPAIDAWRASVQPGTPGAHPSPNSDCPPSFGNTDIFGGMFSDPTP